MTLKRDYSSQQITYIASQTSTCFIISIISQSASSDKTVQKILINYLGTLYIDQVTILVKIVG